MGRVIGADDSNLSALRSHMISHVIPFASGPTLKSVSQLDMSLGSPF
jgi:hypothetical protein